MRHKIVFFLDFPHGTGGSSKVLVTQACIMSKKGYNVIVVIPNDKEGMHISLYDEICNANHLDTVTATYSISTSIEQIDIIEALSSYSDILQLLEKEKPDLVHSVQINIAVELAARELGIPHLMNIYPVDLEAFVINWMDILPHYHSADSELFVERWGKGLCIPSRCIRVAYQCECKKKLDVMDDMVMPIRLLSVAVLAEHKNQMELLKFVLICKKRGISVILTVLGDNNTPYGRSCLEYVKENKLEGEVAFLGYVKNVEDYFAQADLLILSSKVESFPGVIVESMANKVPVLSTPIAGIPELLQDGYNCFLTKGCCAEDIYETFGCYLSYRRNGNLQNIIDQAYSDFLRNHSYEAVGAQLELYYNWILEDYRTKSFANKFSEVNKQFECFLNGINLSEMNLQTRQSLWYLYHINKINNIKKFQKILIWGAGTFGKVAAEWLEILGCKDRLVGYIDTYKKGEYLGYPILEDREKAIKICDTIFCAVGDINSCLEIMKYLEQYGKKRNRDYFMIQNGPIRV